MDTRYLASVISGCLVVLLVFMAAVQAQSRLSMLCAIQAAIMGWMANVAAEYEYDRLHKLCGGLSILSVLAALWLF